MSLEKVKPGPAFPFPEFARLHAPGTFFRARFSRFSETNGQTTAVVEAFNLTCLDRNVISGHLEKIFGYDIHGLRENFILVYVDTMDFAALWSKYADYIKDFKYPYPLTGAMETVDTGKAEIKCACTVHGRTEEETRLYHLFINMRGKSSA